MDNPKDGPPMEVNELSWTKASKEDIVYYSVFGNQIKSGPLLIWHDWAGTLLESVVAEHTLMERIQLSR